MVDWISLSQTAGTSGTTTITVTASSYSELLERSTSLTVNAGDKSAVVTIQQAFDENFSVNPTSFSVDKDLNYCYITINSDLPWACTSAPDWCSFSPVSASSGQQIAMVVTANTGSVRTGTVIFTQSGTGIQRSVSVQQADANSRPITIRSESRNFPAGGGDILIQVVTDYPWTLDFPAWISSEVTAGTGTTNIIITAEPNTGMNRSGYVSASTSTDTARLSFAQTGGFIIPSAEFYPSLAEVNYLSGYTNPTLTANCNWRLETDVDWIRLSTYSGGSGETIVYIYYEENHRVDNRTGHISVYQYGTTNLLDRFSVMQDEAPVTFEITGVSGGTLEFNRTGETKTISVYSNVPWDCYNTTLGNHFTISPASGQSGTTEITITAAENTEYLIENTLRFEFAGETEDITLYQKPIPRISFNPSSLSLSSAATSTTFTVDTNVPWYEENSTFISVDPTQYLEWPTALNHIFTITVSVPDNGRSPYDRVGDIIFTNYDDQTYLGTMTVTQEAGLVVTEAFPYTVLMLSDGVLAIDAGITPSGGSWVYDRWTDYTFDGTTWESSPTGGTEINVSKGDIISFITPNGVSHAATPQVIDGEYNAYGNVLSLDKYNYSGSTEAENMSFDYLWTKRHNYELDKCDIVRAEYLILPLTISTSGGNYSHAFENCAKLVAAPEMRTVVNDSYFYDSTFRNCTSLEQAPQLPYDGAIPSYGYIRMFEGCTNLVEAPELPSTSLGNYAYSYMFRYCSSLEEAPVLSATTVGIGVYSSMFCGCSNLRTAANLPVVSAAIAQYMYKDCTSLVNPPLLPATVAEACYRGMFQRCTSLETAPTLHATELIDECYKWMFSGCSSLNYIKCMATANTQYYGHDVTSAWTEGVASAGTFVYNEDAPNYYWTIGNSGIPTNWVTSAVPSDIIDVSPAGYTFPRIGGSVTLAVRSNYDWHVTENLSWLTVSPMSGTSATTAVTLTATENGFSSRSGDVTFTSIFDTVVRISQNGRPQSDVTTPLTFVFYEDGQLIVRARRDAAGFAYRYNKVGSWTHVDLSGGDNRVININSSNRTVEIIAGGLNNTLSNNLNITSTSRHEVYGNVQRLFFTTSTAYTGTTLNITMGGLFSGSTGLVDASSLILPATTLNKEKCYQYMFENCTSLVKGPELNFTEINAEDVCGGMFAGCRSLTAATADLFTINLTPWCYQGMFYNCSSLRQGPILPASVLARGCYSGLFQGCSILNSITCFAQSGLNNTNLNDWVDGVSVSGVFTKESGVTWPSGNNGIPTGWTVEDA